MTRARHNISLLIGSVAAQTRMRPAVPAPGAFTDADTAATDANAHALARRTAP